MFVTSVNRSGSISPKKHKKANFKSGYYFVNCSTMHKLDCRELISGLQRLHPIELNVRLSSDQPLTGQEFLDSFVAKKLESAEVVCGDCKEAKNIFDYLNSKINILPFFFYSSKRPESQSKLIESLNHLAEDSLGSFHGPC